MSWLKCAAVAAMSFVVLTSGASAAETNGKPIWSGWYVGIEGGWARAQAAQTNTKTNVSDGYYGQGGGLAGGTFGYNWQMADWVVGLETDLAWSGIKGEETICGPAHNQICPTELRSFGTARGRVGYLVIPSTMIYAAGGLAYGEIKAYKETVAVTGGDDWRTGWTIGGGVETMFAPHWSFKVEYLYATFPGTATTYTITASSTPISAVERDIHMVRGGVNWHF
ncbi:MAG TPA: outer membrane protein [Pseudolabrys sp.]|nr:outer membrane protein [Pseudolabrys sp.]